MKKLLRATFVMIVLVLPAPVFAPGADFPEPQGYVADTVGVVNAETKEKIVAFIRTLHDKTTAQAAVAVVDTTGEMPIEEYSTKLFEKWGVGAKGKDNGALLVVAVSDRKMRIEVGYGLEGAVPDAAAGEIIDNIIKPKFKAGDLNGGIEAGMEALAARIAKEYALTPQDIGLSADAGAAAPAEEGGAEKASPAVLALVVGIFLLVILFIVFVFWKLSRMSVAGGSGAGSDDENGTRRRESSSDDSDSSSSDSFGGGSSGGGGASGEW